MTTFAIWSGGLSAFGFAAVAIWLHHRTLGRRASDKVLLAALLLTAGWGLSIALGGPASPAATLAETLRNAGWLTFLCALRKDRGTVPRTLQALFAVLFAVLLALAAWDVLGNGVIGPGEVIWRMLFSSGALVVVHNIYHLTGARRQSGLALALATVAMMWTYDLGLYLFALLPGTISVTLLYGRGLAVALLTPLLAVALRDTGKWRLSLSRQAAFRTASLGAIALYLGIAVLLGTVVGERSTAAGVTLMFLLSLGAIAAIPSDRVRATAKILLTKHFFRHRYDYRSEWMRFACTIGRAGADDLPIGTRVAKALADVLEAPAGLLLLREDEAWANSSGARVTFGAGGQWNWTADVSQAFAPQAVTLFEEHGHIADCDAVRAQEDALLPPAWLPPSMTQDDAVFAIVPLVHLERLVGLVLLARPVVARALDWEDFDVLRAAGRQAASYLAEAQGQARLTEARQFDEFNRRFAFVLHDIKNVVSQLGLIARNAERHADNPEFHVDMIATVQGAAVKMHDLLARLDGSGPARPMRTEDIPLASFLREAALDSAGGQHVAFEGPKGIAVSADPDVLRTILAHLIQNAAEAGNAGEAIRIAACLQGDAVALDVIDRGCGMDDDFLRCDLFRPFVSRKAGGFGLGAHESRALARSMGGDLTAASRIGEGSIFTLTLPAASARRRQTICRAAA